MRHSAARLGVATHRANNCEITVHDGDGTRTVIRRDSTALRSYQRTTAASRQGPSPEPPRAAVSLHRARAHIAQVARTACLPKRGSKRHAPGPTVDGLARAKRRLTAAVRHAAAVATRDEELTAQWTASLSLRPRPDIQAERSAERGRIAHIVRSLCEAATTASPLPNAPPVGAATASPGGHLATCPLREVPR